MDRTIVKMVFGSHLYGLATENSDTDYKGIAIPSLKDHLLCRAFKSINESTGKEHEKNTKDDIDSEMYSLLYFVYMASQGETVAMDMLHAPESALIETSDVWEELVSLRDKFYTKNMKAYLGYVKRQAAKYGIKGSKLAEIKEAIEFLKGLCPSDVLGISNAPNPLLMREVWDGLYTGEHIYKEETKGVPRQFFYCVAGKKYQSTLKVSDVRDKLQRIYDGYGERAKAAERNEGIDWKAMSHALRVGYQMRDIFQKGSFEYPLAETSTLKLVKEGRADYKYVAETLEELIEEVEKLAKESDLPEKVDHKFWENWVLEKQKELLL